MAVRECRQAVILNYLVDTPGAADYRRFGWCDDHAGEERGRVMARKKSSALTDGELRIMHVLWDRSRANVGDVVEHLDGDARPAYNTVLTMLRILERKGYVTHQKDGRAFTFVPLVDRAEARRSAITHVLSRFFNDSPRLLVLNLLGHERVDADELKQVRELIETKTPEPAAKDRRGKTSR
jgi:predicted transcriptional regulator